MKKGQNKSRLFALLLAFLFTFTISIPNFGIIDAKAEDATYDDSYTGQDDVDLYQGFEVIDITDISEEPFSDEDLPTEESDTLIFEESSISVANSASYIRTKNFDIYANTYMRDRLTADEQIFYDKLKSACDNLLKTTNNAYKRSYSTVDSSKSSYVVSETGIPFTNLSKTRAVEVASIFVFQNPQYYFIGPKLLNDGNSFWFACYDEFADGNKRAGITEQLFTKLDGWVLEINKEETDYDKEVMADYIVCRSAIYSDDSSVPYAEFKSTGELNYSQTAYSHIVLGKTVCAGYTKTFEMLMNACGIETVGITSTDHAWNRIKLNGLWYNVDTTWNDIGKESSKEYLNKTDREIISDHLQESYYDDIAPICSTPFTKELLDIGFVSVEGISIEPSSDVKLYINQNKLSEAVSVTVTPSNATDAGYHIYTLDSSIASYYNGKVYAESAGKTELVACTVDGGKTDKLVIEVYDKYTKPSMPTVLSKTTNSITLREIAGCEYSMDKTKWQSSTTFTGLSPNTEYSFYARRAASGYYEASDPSYETVIKTEAEPSKEEPQKDTPKPVTTTATVKSNGIYVSQERPTIIAGCVTEKSDSSAVVEYRWIACDEKEPDRWFEISPWTKNYEWVSYTPESQGNYILVCYARVVGNEDASLIQSSVGVTAHPYIKGKCQMPYTGEGGGYLIGVESFDNPNQSYRYEMLILDCTLLAQGLPAWTYTTGQCGVENGNALWTIWQPQYGYYWTLFRVFDKDGNMLDEECFGFENIY
ncbi:MAG: hypothetical protein IJ141_06775 [Lachnospiraceae bacterium]|nr:hypothetical protein [Lachnospiraceae bacterium]